MLTRELLVPMLLLVAMGLIGVGFIFHGVGKLSKYLSAKTDDNPIISILEIVGGLIIIFSMSAIGYLLLYFPQ